MGSSLSAEVQTIHGYVYADSLEEAKYFIYQKLGPEFNLEYCM